MCLGGIQINIIHADTHAPDDFQPGIAAITSAVIFVRPRKMMASYSGIICSLGCLDTFLVIRYVVLSENCFAVFPARQ